MNKVIENLKLRISSTPHIMLDVIIALMPAAFAGVFYFGRRALGVMIVSVISCVGFEWLYQTICHKKRTVNDYSAVVTGLLLALIMPVSVPYYMIIIGGFVSIVITKQLFGGIGQNFMNPALIGRAFLLASFPVAMTTFPGERMELFDKITDVITGATPLSAEYQGAVPTAMEQFLGRYNTGLPIAGCIGETCTLALIIGLVYLLIRKVISVRIPISFLGCVSLMALLFGNNAVPTAAHPLLAIMSGGVMLAAVFMATDYVTSPTTPMGQIIYGIGCGVLTSIIRFWGGYPEGVTYAILLMNVLTPLLDKWTVPKAFGCVKDKG